MGASSFVTGSALSVASAVSGIKAVEDNSSVEGTGGAGGAVNTWLTKPPGSVSVI